MLPSCSVKTSLTQGWERTDMGPWLMICEKEQGLQEMLASHWKHSTPSTWDGVFQNETEDLRGLTHLPEKGISKIGPSYRPENEDWRRLNGRGAYIRNNSAVPRAGSAELGAWSAQLSGRNLTLFKAPPPLAPRQCKMEGTAHVKTVRRQLPEQGGAVPPQAQEPSGEVPSGQRDLKGAWYATRAPGNPD